ncbi:hypothetical protein HanPSC8_Chr01g0000741 [Helianthus annuus]|nr:hypothetical protein HanIR_Chr01g0001061 [Helianthus annuus]KAJ0955250.1 hypothetical protein HanPSC8_Chr01g0000741 [Helianthus annuus]
MSDRYLHFFFILTQNHSCPQILSFSMPSGDQENPNRPQSSVTAFQCADRQLGFNDYHP